MLLVPLSDLSEEQVAQALADPDGRLGLILEATVAAFEADPSEPLQFHPMGQAALVRHEHWPLPATVVGAHDLQQLEELELISAGPGGRKSLTFWPTIRGRAAVKDVASYLERVARETDDEGEKSRLQRWASRIRAGDVAVGAVGGTSGVLIRALLGL